MINHRNVDLSEKIIEHLRLKKKTGDDLSGIVLAIYQKELKELSDKILNNLSELIKRGSITEIRYKDGKRYYKLVETSNL